MFKIGNLQCLKAGSDILLCNVFNILDRMNLKCGIVQFKTANQSIDKIQGHFYERYNFYMDSCTRSPSAFLFKLYCFQCFYKSTVQCIYYKSVHKNSTLVSQLVS